MYVNNVHRVNVHIASLTNSPYHRLEMTELAGSPVIEEVAVKTNSNTAYEMMKQYGQGGRLADDYEPISSPPGGPPS